MRYPAVQPQHLLLQRFVKPSADGRFIHIHSTGVNMIVKIQLPISTNDPEPMMLIYNKGRSFQSTTPVTDRFAKELKEFPHKGYYMAEEIRGSEPALTIGRRVAEQDW